MANVEFELNEQELEEIREIFEKKTSLESLAKIVDPSANEALYNRLLSDYQKVSTDFQSWWDKQTILHNLHGKHCFVDFVNSTVCSD